jgi:hypothetical protein
MNDEQRKDTGKWPGPSGCTLKSALAALLRLKIEPLTLAHGVLFKENLKWPISGRNAHASIFETASRSINISE